MNFVGSHLQRTVLNIFNLLRHILLKSLGRCLASGGSLPTLFIASGFLRGSQSLHEAAEPSTSLRETRHS